MFTMKYGNSAEMGPCWKIRAMFHKVHDIYCLPTNVHTVRSKQVELEQFVQKIKYNLTSVTEIWWNCYHRWKLETEEQSSNGT